MAGNRYPLDREGHGTFVTGVIAESTNNGFGLTGLAYSATIMPVRVLDSSGYGDAATISKGIRYAVKHGAQVINLSLEFDPSVTAADIPGIVSAIRYAHQHRVVVVAASGNESESQIAYPARDADAISVGATTLDGCLANYSNGGPKLDLVAPGGGDDATLPDDPACHPNRNLPDIYQMTFGNAAHPGQVRLPGRLVWHLDGGARGLGGGGDGDRERRARAPPDPQPDPRAPRGDGAVARRGQAERGLRLRAARHRCRHSHGDVEPVPGTLRSS